MTQYEEDAEAHRMFFRAVIDRGSVCGQVVTTVNRDGFRVQFAPGDVNRVFDFDYRSGKDDAWDKLAQKLGGIETWKALAKPVCPACPYSLYLPGQP